MEKNLKKEGGLHRFPHLFFRAQGACLAHIRPQYLLDLQEFEHWCLLQVSPPEHLLCPSPSGETSVFSQSGPEEDRLDRRSYESVSKRSWTHVLLQIYKVSQDVLVWLVGFVVF